MEIKKTIKHEINGVYGNVTYSDLNLNGEYYPSRYNSEERSVNTRETISYTDEVNGLPEGVSMDDYFGMALLQRLDNIERKLNTPQNINISCAIDGISEETLNKIVKAIREG